MQCCESHGKGAWKSAPKKAKYYAGVAVTNHIAGCHQANCNHFEIYKTLKDPRGNLDSLIQSGSAELCGVMNQDFSCMLQRGVFEDLVWNTIVNASLPQLSMEEEVSWCGTFLAAGMGKLLHCEKSIHALEYRRILL